MTGQAEVLRQALAAVAEEMGETLARAAFSPNIKERRDHSCAVFTAAGELVAQAEHIPVHLGAMPASVAAVREALEPLTEGDVALVNDPYRGGTHLPDLTMVAPVFHGEGLLAYVAARAHHADVGGKSPGSMPAHATTLEEEGLVLPPVLYEDQGARVEEVQERILSSTRTPRERRGDLAAQVGSLRIGARRIRELARRRGVEPLREGMAALLDHTERLVRARLAKARAGTYRGEAVLTDEAPEGALVLRLTAELSPDRLALDYAGTDPQTRTNLNAPRPVTLSGALYVLRLLLGADVPSNAGLGRVLSLSIPPGSLLDPEPGAAVAGGNVETSQRNVDLLLSTLQPAFPDRVPAQSQGTMNNLTLGGAGFTYYETLGGGEGATPTRPGMSGVHTHMTNTRNTPVEALEHALPLRVLETTLRRGSGGAGRHRGGDGIRRSLQALADGIEANLISTRRDRGPAGLAGGKDGAPGRNAVRRADGRQEALGGIARVVLGEGDVLTVETPGGGGWGGQEG